MSESKQFGGSAHNSLLGGAIFGTLISLFLYYYHSEQAEQTFPDPVLPNNELNLPANVALEDFNKVAMLANPFTTIPNNGKYYTLEEVSKHDTKDDLWVVFFDRVFDISKFVANHPGGEEILVSHSGMDVSKQFVEFHPDFKRLFPQAKQYYIGELKKTQQ